MRFKTAFHIAWETGRWWFVVTIIGVLLAFGWLAYAVIENNGPLCSPTTEGYCSHGKVTPK